jgi:hypothetical protein
VIRIALRSPYYAVRGGSFVLKGLWALRRGLLASRGKTGKITFFVQNFQDADDLDPERIAHCSFKVMTDEGPVSMCEHNARRAEFILKPLPAHPGPGGR